MFERVTVVGAGVAGCAAAWAAAQRGAALRIFDAGVGATSLSGGAIDDRPWEEVARSAEIAGVIPAASAVSQPLAAFVDDLGLWRLPPAGAPLCRLVTEAGRVRLARGHERGLLDLSELPPAARVVLPRFGRSGWHPESLARALSADVYARSRGLRFDVVDATLLKHIGEDRIADADLAGRHDDPARLGWLLERLAELLHRAGDTDALLLGSWLGVRRPLSETISTALGVRVGETVAAVGGTVGLRFEAARARLFSSSGLALEPARATAVVSGQELEVVVEGKDRVTTDAVVIAIGGMISGGITYDPPEQRAGTRYADAGGAPFRVGVTFDGAAIQAGGRLLDVVSSMHGPALEASAWPRDADPGLIEAVGLRCDGLEAAARIFAAGDVVADKPRTILQSAAHGLLAGAAAAGEPGVISR